MCHVRDDCTRTDPFATLLLVIVVNIDADPRVSTAAKEGNNIAQGKKIK